MVKYRSKLVRGYGKAGGIFNEKEGKWLNLYLIISAIFSFLFFVFAMGQANTDNPVIAIIGLLGLLSIFTTPMLFFVAITCSKLSYGTPNFSFLSSIANQTKKEIEPLEPLEGYEDCSPQYQAYMRKQIAKQRKKEREKQIKLEGQELLISELKNKKFKTKKEKDAYLKQLAKKRVDQLNRKKRKPTN
mgnify:CR=1 FL=1|tara:strand:+ start:95 stop:658 length:564 start_codon:yes stop_codon:yes gene_type:complete